MRNEDNNADHQYEDDENEGGNADPAMSAFISMATTMIINMMMVILLILMLILILMLMLKNEDGDADPAMSAFISNFQWQKCLYEDGNADDEFENDNVGW